MRAVSRTRTEDDRLSSLPIGFYIVLNSWRAPKGNCRVFCQRHIKKRKLIDDDADMMNFMLLCIPLGGFRCNQIDVRFVAVRRSRLALRCVHGTAPFRTRLDNNGQSSARRLVGSVASDVN